MGLINRLPIVFKLFSERYPVDVNLNRKLYKTKKLLEAEHFIKGENLDVYNECIDMVHGRIFSNAPEALDELDIAMIKYTIEAKPVLKYTDKMIETFTRIKSNPPRVDVVDDINILFAFMTECGFRKCVIEKLLADTYLPYSIIQTPYHRDATLKVRYVLKIDGKKLIVQVPDTNGAYEEELNQKHIDLAKLQK